MSLLEYVKIMQTIKEKKTRNSETIYVFTISLEHKTTYAHFHMFLFPHEENIS